MLVGFTDTEKRKTIGNWLEVVWQEAPKRKTQQPEHERCLMRINKGATGRKENKNPLERNTELRFQAENEKNTKQNKIQ